MANGSFAGGDGSPSNPYLIEDANDLNAVRNKISASYKLIKDIDLNVSPYNEGGGWISIGNGTTLFTGTFDGNGHIIKNLYINSTSNHRGLFGYTSGSTIKNIRLENINISASSNVGGLVSDSNSYSTISNSYVTGNITGTNCVGGVVGANSTSTILNSYSNAKVTGSAYVGGLTGRNTNGIVSNCYSVGIVIAPSYVGGLVGYNSGTVNNSYWDMDTSGRSSSAEGTGLTTVQMKTPSSFVSWDTQVLDDGITKVWKLTQGEYPKLWFEKFSINTNFLIKDKNNTIYTYDEVNNIILQTSLQELNSDNFKENGFNDPLIIPEEIWNSIFPDKIGLELLMWTDDTTITQSTVTCNIEPYKLLDKLNNQFEIRMMKAK